MSGGLGPVAGGPGGPGGPWVVAVGGGHGLSSTLKAVRRYAGRLTAVVSVADDGGSSGRLRATTGLPAPGDLRRCLVALADSGSLWARAMEHRFVGGDLDGHALGNLIIAGLAEVTGDFGAALDAASALLGVSARVLPATEGPVTLKGSAAGHEIVGQVNVQESVQPVTEVSVEPAGAPAPPEAVEAIAAADQVILGPGSLFTSVLAACVVPAVRGALASRAGGTVLVVNLRPQVPETAGLSPAAHLRTVLDHGVRVDTTLVDAAWPPEGPELEGLKRVAAAAGVRLLRAEVGRPGRDGHDPERLAVALSALLPG